MSDEDYDDEPRDPRRCYGPHIDNSHGCGRYIKTGSGLCADCKAETDSYWEWHQQQEAADMQRQEEFYRQESEYHAAQKAAHPDTVTQCAWCYEVHLCSWQGYDSYTCVDRALCDARCLDIHERSLGFEMERAWGRDAA